MSKRFTIVVVVIIVYKTGPDQLKILVLDESDTGTIYFRILFPAFTVRRRVGVENLNTAGKIGRFARL